MLHILRYLKQSHFFIFLFLFLSACGESQQERLTISSSPWPGYEPLYLARDLGYFGNNVKLFELPSSDITMESFRNGSSDIASLTLAETLDLLQDGIKLRILLILDISNGGDAVMAKPEIKKLSDIKGKRISIVNTPLGLYMLNRLLDKTGLQRNEVTVFPMSETHQESFYKDDKADIVISYDPVKSNLSSLGMHVLFDSSDIPNEIFDLLVVHEDVYQKRFNEVCGIARQWFKTLDYIKSNNKNAVEHMGKRLGVDASTYHEMMKGLIIPSMQDNNKLVGGDKPGLLGPAKKLAKIMLKEKQLFKNIDASVALDKKFMECVNK